MPTWAIWITRIVLALWSLWCLSAMLAGIEDLRRAAASADWPTAPGKMTVSKIGVEEADEGGRRFFPVLEYSYAVAGQNHVGHQRVIGHDFGLPISHRGVRRILEPFPVGSAVTVAYNPLDPAEAVLQPGLQKASFSQIVVACGMLVLGGIFWLISWLASPDEDADLTTALTIRIED